MELHGFEFAFAFAGAGSLLGSESALDNPVGALRAVGRTDSARRIHLFDGSHTVTDWLGMHHHMWSAPRLACGVHPCVLPPVLLGRRGCQHAQVSFLNVRPHYRSDGQHTCTLGSTDGLPHYFRDLRPIPLPDH